MSFSLQMLFFATLLLTTLILPNLEASGQDFFPAIKTGKGPWAVAVNPVTNMVYVTNTNTEPIRHGGFSGFSTPVQGPGYGTVSVINGTINSTMASMGANPIGMTVNNTVATIPVGVLPKAIAINSQTNRIYVANEGSNTVSVINGFTNNILATVNLGGQPSGIAVNDKTDKIYVANPAKFSVSVIDGSTNQVMDTIKLGNKEPSDVSVNEETNKIYISNFGGSVSVIDGSTNTLKNTIKVESGPYNIAVNPVTNKIYTGGATDSGAISVIDGVQENVTKTIQLGSSLSGIAVDPVKNRIYVADKTSNGLFILDGLSDTWLREKYAYGYESYGVAVNPNTGRAYATDYADGFVWITDEQPANPSIPISDHVILSPLKQIKSGILPKYVECKQGLELVINTENGNPACVKPQTAQTLVERGWGMIPSSSTSKLMAH